MSKIAVALAFLVFGCGGSAPVETRVSTPMGDDDASAVVTVAEDAEAGTPLPDAAQGNVDAGNEPFEAGADVRGLDVAVPDTSSPPDAAPTAAEIAACVSAACSTAGAQCGPISPDTCYGQPVDCGSCQGHLGNDSTRTWCHDRSWSPVYTNTCGNDCANQLTNSFMTTAAHTACDSAASAHGFTLHWAVTLVGCEAIYNGNWLDPNDMTQTFRSNGVSGCVQANDWLCCP